MVSGMLPKKIDKTLECYLMCTSKWTLEANLWNTKKKRVAFWISVHIIHEEGQQLKIRANYVQNHVH